MKEEVRINQKIGGGGGGGLGLDTSDLNNVLLVLTHHRTNGHIQWSKLTSVFDRFYVCILKN